MVRGSYHNISSGSARYRDSQTRPAERQRHQQVWRIGGILLHDVKQRRRLNVPQQAAEGQEEGNHLSAQYDSRHAAHRFRAHPDDKGHQQRKAEARSARVRSATFH